MKSVNLLLLLLLSLSPLYRVFTHMSPRQTLSLVDTLLQLLFHFTVNTLYDAYLPRSYVGSDGLLRQHFPHNVCAVPNMAVSVVPELHGFLVCCPRIS